MAGVSPLTLPLPKSSIFILNIAILSHYGIMHVSPTSYKAAQIMTPIYCFVLADILHPTNAGCFASFNYLLFESSNLD